VAATAPHVAVVVALVEGFGTHPTPANAVAFVVATVLGYTANSIWSFNAGLSRRSLARYVVVSVIGLILTIVLSSAIATANLPYLLGVALVVTFVPVLNFVMHRNWTYRVNP
jgi:putative flippase GtrA